MGLMAGIKHAFKDDDKESVHSSSHHSHHSKVEAGAPVRTSTTVETTEAVVPVVPVVQEQVVQQTTVVPEVSEIQIDRKNVNVTHAAPVIDQQVKVNEAIVQERLRTDIVEEVTPEIQINKSQVEIQQVIQEVEDKKTIQEHVQKVNPTLYKERTEAIADADAARYQANANAVQESHIIEEGSRTSHVNPAHVTENVHITQIQEITPVIKAEHVTERIIHTDQQIVEKYTAAPKVLEVQVKPPITLEEFKAQGGVVAEAKTHAVREL